MKINSARLQSYFEAMSEIGKIGETGTCRPAHTALEKQGFEIARSWMKEAGMTTEQFRLYSERFEQLDRAFYGQMSDLANKQVALEHKAEWKTDIAIVSGADEHAGAACGEGLEAHPGRGGETGPRLVKGRPNVERNEIRAERFFPAQFCYE